MASPRAGVAWKSVPKSRASSARIDSMSLTSSRPRKWGVSVVFVTPVSVPATAAALPWPDATLVTGGARARLPGREGTHHAGPVPAQPQRPRDRLQPDHEPLAGRPLRRG